MRYRCACDCISSYEQWQSTMNVHWSCLLLLSFSFQFCSTCQIHLRDRVVYLLLSFLCVSFLFTRCRVQSTLCVVKLTVLREKSLLYSGEWTLPSLSRDWFAIVQVSLPLGKSDQGRASCNTAVSWGAQGREETSSCHFPASLVREAFDEALTERRFLIPSLNSPERLSLLTSHTCQRKKHWQQRIVVSLFLTILFTSRWSDRQSLI